MLVSDYHTCFLWYKDCSSYFQLFKTIDPIVSGSKYEPVFLQKVSLLKKVYWLAYTVACIFYLNTS